MSSEFLDFFNNPTVWIVFGVAGYIVGRLIRWYLDKRATSRTDTDGTS